MARKYTRDNRGRFASGSGGATARGGRLRTASGNKRERKTMTVKNQRTVVLRKQDKPKSAATSGLRPGEIMNAVARPRNVMAKPQASDPKTFKGTKKANISQAQGMLKAEGIQNVGAINKRSSRAAAWAQPQQGSVTLNASHSYWENPRKSAIHNRRTGQLSTSDPKGIVFHEAAHLKFKQSDNFRSLKDQNTAGRVSKYARMNPKEFVSETYAGIRTGRKYDREVMGAYRSYLGKPSKPQARRRSRLK